MPKSLITSRQEKQLRRFIEDALGKVTMTSEEWQRVLAQRDELQKAIIGSVVELGKGKFPDEEVESSYVYPSGYRSKDITAQTNTLRELFLGVGYAKEGLAEASLPKGAEAFFAIPQWQKMAETYEKAVERVFQALASKSPFYNYREGELGPEYLKRSERTERMLQTLARQQGNQDILIVPAQFGLRHRGRSVRRAREMLIAQEFGLGAFEVGIMLLTHPERLTDFNDLWVDCPGDEYSPGAGDQFDGAPYFDFDGDEVRFDASWTGDALGHYGSVSAFLSQ